MNQDGLQSSSPSREFLGILRDPLGWLLSPPPSAITNFIYSGHPSAFKPCKRPSGRRTWEHIGYNQDVVGHGDKAYLMRPVASISLGTDSEVTACLRHQRHLSCVRAYGTLEWGSVWTRITWKSLCLRSYFSRFALWNEPWKNSNLELHVTSACRGIHILYLATSFRIQVGIWMAVQTSVIDKLARYEKRTTLSSFWWDTHVCWVMGRSFAASDKWRLIKVGGSCLFVFQHGEW